VIDAVDTILRQILVTGVPNMTTARLSFQPPDDEWRQRVGSAQGILLNVYLVDIHEDRKLRSNEVDRVLEQGILRETPAPTRVRLTYLVSAWSAVADAPGNTATENEHDTLSFVLRALLRACPFNASRVLPAAAMASVPVGMREVDLPTTVAAPEGFPKLAEFWSTMGKSRPLKPVVTVGVTVPVTYPEQTIEGIVLSIDTSLGDLAEPTVDPERLIELGGHVLDAVGPNAAQPLPVRDAVVIVGRPGGRRVTGARSGADGSFVVDGLPPGDYEVSFAADGYAAAAPMSVTVPQPTGGSLELLFT
jgi:hypothetical protein